MTKKINKTIIYKALAIAVMTLLMLIPLTFVHDTIGDRGSYRSEAVSEIVNSWGGNVIVAAPILNIPYTYEERLSSENGVIKSVEKVGYAKYTPDNLSVEVKTNSQIRYIGIFEVPVFTADVVMKGNFGELFEYDAWDKFGAFISFEINNLKGISVPSLEWNGENKTFEPSNYGEAIALNDSFTFKPRKGEYYYAERIKLSALNANIGSDKNQKGEFELRFSIKGSESLNFLPLAKNNKFHISSDWQNPNFSGAFLPDTKEITDKGFDAFWNINYLASGIAPRVDTQSADELSRAVFATSFLVPVDNYRNAERAVKYGILFIVLTFAVCFAFEVANKKPIHPIQYLLVGFAMVIFYTLLISISEFISFTSAYLLAATATIALISAYAKIGIVKDMSVKQVAIVVLSLTFLYGFLYILLQLQDMALLYGSIGLFIALGILMYMTRNIGWYEEN